MAVAVLALFCTVIVILPAALAASEIEFIPTADSADALSTDSLSDMYQERIERLELEIRNESERRTTILLQLDAAMTKASALENESRDINDNALPLDSSLQQIHTEIEVLERDIKHNHSLLEQMQITLDRQPELSIWQAALGTPEVQTRQKLQATQSYLLHTTRKHQQQLETHRVLLDKRYQALVDYDQSVKNSINTAKTQFATVIEQRQVLEGKLTEISAQIVARQDRVLSLTDRSQQLQSDPNLRHFSNLNKKLKDPIAGRVVREFSEPKAKGLLKWKGILVEAPLGLPFTAVSDGLVVFADQLQGLGNVAIVDHGEGYMTLYGMAELLLVEQDQFLLAGDPIGTVGESVSADVSALYFEVRHNADALDPQDWLEMHQIAQKNALQRLFLESK